MQYNLFDIFTDEEVRWMRIEPGWKRILPNAPDEIRQSILKKCKEHGFLTRPPSPEELRKMEEKEYEGCF